MGMYTEFKFCVRLRGDTSEGILSILEYMLDRNGYDKEVPKAVEHQQHNFFESEYWSSLFLSTHAYAIKPRYAKLNVYKQPYPHYNLCVRSSLKNYNNKIDAFLDWIEPYVDDAFYTTATYIGHKHYEEYPHPIPIFYTSKKGLYYVPPENNEIER